MKIPVIKGRIGDWVYYSGVMKFSQIAESVTASVNEIYDATCLDELLQRELTDNYTSIKKYILADRERFFNAIILAIFNGDPQWLEVEFSDDESEFTNVGFLEFKGGETIFPVDGQHRVAGICKALDENPGLASEQVPVVFIAHSNTPDGRKRTRKLFSTLNRRAKPVGQNENIALDEDDICSIVTRELVQEFPLFMGQNVINSLGKQIPPTNSVALTSLIALYQCVEVIVKHRLAGQGIKGQKYRDYKLYRPSDEDVKEIKEYTFGIFAAFETNTAVIGEYLRTEETEKARAYRNPEGGNILFRPIALTEYFEAMSILLERGDGFTPEDAFARLNSIELDISHRPWLGLVWDGKNIISKASKIIIRLLFLHMAEPGILTSKELEKLVQGYASGINISDEAAKQALGIANMG